MHFPIKLDEAPCSKLQGILKLKYNYNFEILFRLFYNLDHQEKCSFGKFAYLVVRAFGLIERLNHLDGKSILPKGDKK